MKISVIKIGIFCDLSPLSGLGHLKRMINLTNSIEKTGNTCIFFFEKKNLNFIKKYTKNLNIFFVDNIDNFIFLSDLLSELKVSKIIIDSYNIDNKLENHLVKKNFFVVAIDDHYKKHAANIVISNRSEKPKITLIKRNQIWLTGPKYALIGINNKKLIGINNKKNTSRKKVLLHAGGLSLYKNLKVLIVALLTFLRNKNISLTILCTNTLSKKYVINLCHKNRLKLKLKFINYSNKFSSTFSKYNIIFGPAGTTTFEIIAAGSMPFSFPVIDDGRDSCASWSRLGHLMHLKAEEIKDKKILFDSFDLIFKRRNKFLNILKKNSKLIDGKGPDRVAKVILGTTRSKSLYKNNFKIKNIHSYSSEICSFSDLRNFMASRNYKSSRSASFNYNHIITWPEHLNWWLDKNILKYKVTENSNTVAYYWMRKKKDSFGPFVQSGWFLERNVSKNKNLNYKLKICSKTLKFQVSEVKKIYKKIPWIVMMRKKNKFVKFLNKYVGFKDPSKLSMARVENNYSNIKFSKNFDVLEMKL